MTNEKLYELLGDIDETMINEAAHTNKRSKKPLFITIGATAAAAILAFTATAIYKTENPFEVVKVITPNNDELNTAPILKWEDRTIFEQYTDIKKGDTTTYESTGGIVPETLIGSHIESTMLYGYDEINNKAHIISGEVYEIKNVSSDYAVAVKISGTDTYYSYRNYLAKPSDLGEFIDAFALAENLQFNKAYTEYKKPLSGKTINVYYDEIKSDKLWELINNLRSAKNIDNATPELSEQMIKKAVSFSIDVPILGYNNISMSFSENGYLCTNILTDGNAFYIGEDKVKEIKDFVTANHKGCEIITVYETADDSKTEYDNSGSANSAVSTSISISNAAPNRITE